MDTAASYLLSLYRTRGGVQYCGEPVNQLEHAWQSSVAARGAGVSEALQLAAFVHDVGHLIDEVQGTPTLHGHDDRHELAGSWLLRDLGLPQSVWGPVSLHVDSKRFLVASDPDYASCLSEDSRRSLALQGGPMTSAEVPEFLAQPFSAEAILLRRWDDGAKRVHQCAASPEEALTMLTCLVSRAMEAQS